MKADGEYGFPENLESSSSPNVSSTRIYRPELAGNALDESTMSPNGRNHSHELYELDPERDAADDLFRHPEKSASEERIWSPPDLPDRSLFLVDFDGPTDPTFPHNWPLMTK